MNAHLLEHEDGPRDGRVVDTNSPWPARRHRRQHWLWRCGGGDALWRIVGLGGGGCSGARIGRQRRRWHRKRERRRERRRRSTWGARSLRWCIHLDAVLSPRAYCSRIVPSWGSFCGARRRRCQALTPQAEVLGSGCGRGAHLHRGLNGACRLFKDSTSVSRCAHQRKVGSAGGSVR